MFDRQVCMLQWSHESSGLHRIQIFVVIIQKKKTNSHEVALGAAVVTLDGGAGPTAAAKKPGRAPTGSTTWLTGNPCQQQKCQQEPSINP